MMKNIVFAVILCLCSLSIQAEVKLPKLLADGMVLQRETPIVLWGWADTNEQIKVFFKNKTYKAVANKKGDWKITLPKQKAGGPYLLKINNIELKNILIGDVYLCSGQSNMELPLRRVMDLYRDEILKINNPNIRYYKSPYNYSYEGESSDMSDGAKWLDATQENIMEFSATAYFFAAALYEKTNVPVGIVNSSVGGTAIEQWMSAESIKQFPEYTKKPETDWQSITLPCYWRDKGVALEKGVIWFRKEIDVPKALAGKEAQLRLGCIVHSDSTFVNGEFVGNVTYEYPPRIYPLRAGLLKEGKNRIAIRVVCNGGRGGFVEEKPYKIIVPEIPQPYMNLGGIVGDEIDLTGEWEYKIAVLEKTEKPAPKVTALYNGMIAPTFNIPFGGVVWYQGESNVGNRNRYAALLTALITDWRVKFNNPQLPFYIVELADFMKNNKAWKEMQEIQKQAVDANTSTFFIPNADWGEWNDIHPLAKKPLGERIAGSVWRNMNKKREAR
jgi:sialate O-acetylesterase